MQNGTIKFFNVTKGFGFITPDEGGKELFVAAASLAATGVSSLKTGQRVSFETKPDSKGPKAVNIVLLASSPPPQPAEKTWSSAPGGQGKGMTFYHDPANDASHIALDKLRAAGFEPHIVDYLAAPPARDELKNLAVLLRGTDQILVRKYDPLFLELCLDDRFISESEFWQAIFEHPSLINGPIAATETKARVCRSENDVRAFLAAISSDGIEPAPKRKGLPEGILRLMRGDARPAPAEKKKTVESAERKSTEEAGPASIVQEAAVEPLRKSQKNAIPGKTSKPEPKPTPRLKTAVKAKNKPETKPSDTTKSRKPAIRKPATKARRGKKS
jgi:cold shock protein